MKNYSVQNIYVLLCTLIKKDIIELFKCIYMYFDNTKSFNLLITISTLLSI